MSMKIFHIILLLFIALSAWNSLFYFYGYLELAEGQAEKRGYQKFIKGIFHNNMMDNISIRQGKIEISYHDVFLTNVVSHLKVIENYKLRRGEIGREYEVTVAPLKPFSWKGYKIYLHRERGYAAELFYEKGGKVEKGFVDFPDFNLNPKRQKNNFVIPGENIGFVAELKIDSPMVKNGDWTLATPKNATIKLERGAEEYLLAKGEEVRLKNRDILGFIGVTRWANYVVYYNPTGWLLGLLGIAAFFCLLIHFAQIFIPRRGNGSKKE